jgi:four helix bundle protein
MDSHRSLRVWQRAGDLVLLVYRISARLPREERYVAVSQIRRAAWSVQNNIAEGNAKLGGREKRRFLDCALASLAEVDSMLATLARLYPLHPTMTARANKLRQEINGGLFAMIRRANPGRG